MLFAAASLAAEGPALPPAEYKPLPVGTVVHYDNRIHEVTRTDGFVTVSRTVGKATRYLKQYAVFGLTSDNLYTTTIYQILEYELDDQGEKNLVALWPLEVGKTADFTIHNSNIYRSIVWKIALKVSATEILNLNGYSYDTYVIEERAETEPAGRSYVGQMWYHPASGLVIKAKRKWTAAVTLQGFNYDPRFYAGDEDNYSLTKVEFPEGTTTHVLSRTKVPETSDKALLAEVQRLKTEADETRKAEAARKAREAEAENARQAEIARLKRELEEKRGAEDARKDREAEEDRAREAEIARLRRAVDEKQQQRAELTEHESKELQARLAEIAQLKQAAGDRRKAEQARKAREAEEEKVRAAEMARVKREAEAARRAVEARKDREAQDAKARADEMARLKREAEEARKAGEARKAEIASLKQALEARIKAGGPGGKNALSDISGVEFGSYHALVIGIEEYKHLPKLKTAVADSVAVARTLKTDYGFKVKLLLDPNHKEIIDSFDEYREALGPKDNLLIYYAGHGWLDEDVDRGYWLPVDAMPKRRSNWVSNATITDTLKGLAAKHVMVVADSCYSGTLVRGADMGPRQRSGDYWKQMAEKWARVAITSGGLEPVADKGGGGHSPFAKAFIDALKNNSTVMDGTTLFNKMRRPVMVAAQQTPRYADVRQAGHDGGDFLFVRK